MKAKDWITVIALVIVGFVITLYCLWQLFIVGIPN